MKVQKAGSGGGPVPATSPLSACSADMLTNCARAGNARITTAVLVDHASEPPNHIASQYTRIQASESLEGALGGLVVLLAAGLLNFLSVCMHAFSVV